MVSGVRVGTYQIKVTLLDSQPPIWRRLLVPSTITLDKLHHILQKAMGWTDSHLHQFRVGNQYFGALDMDSSGDMEDMEDEALVKLNEVLRAEKDVIVYEYDFGDDWHHKIVLEKILPVDPGAPLPCCTAGKRACPPEDCGGILGYADFLAAIQDPKHPEHQEMLDWVGVVDFDPEIFDRDDVNTRFAIRY